MILKSIAGLNIKSESNVANVTIYEEDEEPAAAGQAAEDKGKEKEKEKESKEPEKEKEKTDSKDKGKEKVQEDTDKGTSIIIHTIQTYRTQQCLQWT